MDVEQAAMNHLDSLPAREWKSPSSPEYWSFVEGAEWVSSKLPTKQELELVILGRTANKAADAILKLIQRKMREEQDGY